MRLLLFFLLLFSSASYPDTSFNGHWVGIINQTKLDDEYSFWHELQWRYNIKDSHTRQVLWRPGMLKKISENESVGLYYSLVQNNTKSQTSSTEHRLAQEYNFKLEQFFTRFRLEERFLEDSGPLTFRLRSLFGTLIPYTSKSSFLFFDEIFVNMIQRPWNGDRLFDRNRLFGGMRLSFDKVKFNAGLIYEYVPRTLSDTHEYSFVFFTFF